MDFNRAVAERLEQMATLLELLGEDRFRAAAHARAARAVEASAADLAGADREALMAIEGVGAKIADKIIEFGRTGRIGEHEDLLARVPRGVLGLLDVPGLGPKTASAMWRELGVTDVAALRRAIDDGSILKVPRMGEKAVENLREALAFLEQGSRRLPLGIAMLVAEAIVERLLKVPGATGAVFAGSLRRGRDTVGDIDVLATAKDGEKVHAAFTSMPGVVKVLASGETRSSVMLRADAGAGRSIDEPGAAAADAPVVQCDLRVVPPASWGAALLYFTGSKEHNVRLRERALRQGKTLNEYGLFPLDEKGANRPAARASGATGSSRRAAGAASLPVPDEQAVYAALGLPYIPPELREDRGELDLKETPRLVEVGDIRAELHAHTRASDGSMAIEELARAARSRGLAVLAVTDHSKSSIQANGLSEERLRAHARAIRELNGRIRGLTLLAGAEVDILADGHLDYDDDVLAELDVVVASPHAALRQDPAAATKRLLKVAAHPLVHIIGHPTGRLIGRRAGLSPDISQIVAAAAEHGTAVEVNAHWQRLDLRDAHVHAAVLAHALVAIDCDVHEVGDFGHLRYGVMTARRGWVSPEGCINTWETPDLLTWLRDKRHRPGRAPAPRRAASRGH